MRSQMASPRVEVLVTEGCLHAEEALELARSVTSRLAIPGRVSVVDIDSEETASRTRFYGSPTILVDGDDVEGRDGAPTGLVCRAYEGGRGVPPEWMVEAALLRAVGPTHILFLCVANSARSQMAEGLARTMAPAGAARRAAFRRTRDELRRRLVLLFRRS